MTKDSIISATAESPIVEFTTHEINESQNLGRGSCADLSDNTYNDKISQLCQQVRENQHPSVTLNIKVDGTAHTITVRKNDKNIKNSVEKTLRTIISTQKNSSPVNISSNQPAPINNTSPSSPEPTPIRTQAGSNESAPTPTCSCLSLFQWFIDSIISLIRMLGRGICASGGMVLSVFRACSFFGSRNTTNHEAEHTHVAAPASQA